ncbi:MAG: MFS transporter [Deltaproteobacteria bacterium]|nr:MFS transporter [Deltaproteobacteria bacterium]
MTEDTKLNTRVILALTLVHFTGDFYGSFINPLLPVFVEKYSLSLAQAGLLAGISRFLAFIVQPASGYIADHYRTRFFVLGGPILAMAFIPMVGIAPGYALLLLFIALGSVGQSMFHPTAAGMIYPYSGSHFGLSMSIFNMGGTLAFGVGPLFITWLVQAWGLAVTPFTVLVGLPLIAILFWLVPVPQSEGLENLGFIGSLREALGEVWKAIIIVWIVMVLRAFVGQSFLTFAPILLSREGYSLIAIGSVVSLFVVGGAVSGLAAGHLSDRIGFKPVFVAAHALTLPTLYLLLYVRGTLVYPIAFLAGFFLLATLPLGVALAQQLAPRGKSMVSSLMMGLAFGSGGLMIPLTGKLADLFSIRSVLAFLAVIPAFTVLLILRIPEPNERVPGPDA